MLVGDDVGQRSERAFDDHAGLVVDFARQPDRDRAAQRVAEEVARPSGVMATSDRVHAA